MLYIYRASAGSGKTYRLTRDYIRLLFDPVRERVHRRILAVTFTNKATDEMKTRILRELNALAHGQQSAYRNDLMKEFGLSEDAVNIRAARLLTRILFDYSFFSISTIDGFFQKIIRSFAREIGVNGAYNLELDSSMVLEQAVDNLFLNLSDDENKQLLQWLTHYAEDRIENAENWNIRGEITDLGKEIFKENYQYKAADTSRKLHDKDFLYPYREKLRKIRSDFELEAKKQAESALKQMADFGLHHDDFSYKSTKALENIAGGKMEWGRRMQNMAEDVDNCYSKKTSVQIKSAIQSVYSGAFGASLKALNNLFVNDLFHYNSAILILDQLDILGIMSDLATGINQLLDEQNSMMISDTNLLLNKIIDNSETPFIYEKTGLRVDHYMIDEFQDTSVLQWKNFFPLLDNSLSSGNFNMVVGDVKQSIYRWRNSDWKLLNEQIQYDFSSEQIDEENLDTNWRSDRNIVLFNNSLFSTASTILQQKLNDDLKYVLDNYPDLRKLTNRIQHAYHDVCQQLSSGAGIGKVDFRIISGEDNFREQVLKQLPILIEELQEKGYAPNDLAILVRTNGEADLVIKTLLAYKNSDKAKAGVCYDAMGNEGLLISSSSSVRFLVGMLSLLLNPDDEMQMTMVKYEYFKGSKNMTPQDALAAALMQTNDVDFIPDEVIDGHWKQVSLFEFVENLIVHFGIAQWSGQVIFIRAFQDLIFQFSTGRNADLNSFLNWWNTSGCKKRITTSAQKSTMNIMTIHKSKGLDFNVVVVPFCDWELDKGKGNSKNYLWCNPTEIPFNELPLIPVEYKSRLEKSIFATDYYTEQMHRYMDNLNLAYVAFTRARNEIVGFMPGSKELKDLSDIKQISQLIIYSLLHSGSKTERTVILKDFLTHDESRFMMGDAEWTSVKRDSSKFPESIFPGKYPSSDSNGRLHIRHQTLNYLLDSAKLNESRLQLGLIMHDILKQIKRKSDQMPAIEALVTEGRISESEKQIVEDEMKKFWDIPETSEWFADHLKVLTETTILVPNGNIYRPDRVLIDGQMAIIVDYKFGDIEMDKYCSQVRNYMKQIGEMNYETVGYVCYVQLGKVVKVLN